jgi:release factor glutamine methyltransferase
MFKRLQLVYDAFLEAGVEDPLLETFRLLDVLTVGAIRRAESEAITALHPRETLRIAKMRREGAPLEYILGKAVFMGLQLECNPAALIPRAETELLASVALELIRRKQSGQAHVTVLDMGTGSGNLAVALAVNTHNVSIVASDVSPCATELAQRQVANFKVEDRVKVFCGDLYEPVIEAGYAGQVDVLVCNPPYLPSGTLKKLATEIIDHEPVVALDAGPYGINIYRRLLSGAPEMLKPDGVMAFEIGAGQEKLVSRLLQAVGLGSGVEYRHDSDGNVRVIAIERDRPRCRPCHQLTPDEIPDGYPAASDEQIVERSGGV